VTGRQRRRCK